MSRNYEDEVLASGKRRSASPKYRLPQYIKAMEAMTDLKFGEKKSSGDKNIYIWFSSDCVMKRLV